MTEHATLVTLGVDTHRDVHVAAALDALGRQLGFCEIHTNVRGFKQLVGWASQFGVIDRVGIEGCGSYGAGLSRWLRSEGLAVVEIDRPDRQLRRRRGKSDTVDALAAARTVQAGAGLGTPKSGDGPVEAIRVLRVAYRSAVKSRSQAAHQLHALVITAPVELRQQLESLPIPRLVATAARFRCGDDLDGPAVAAKFAMRSLARRWQHLTDEMRTLQTQIAALVTDIAPRMLERYGIGVHSAADLLISAGDNPHRLTNEGSFAHLTGVAPLDASSGRQQRHRLNRGGDRHANAALHRIVITRLRGHPPTQAYAQRRSREGKTRREIIRCLKRYVAREIHGLLTDALATDTPALT